MNLNNGYKFMREIVFIGRLFSSGWIFVIIKFGIRDSLK